MLVLLYVCGDRNKYSSFIQISFILAFSTTRNCRSLLSITRGRHVQLGDVTHSEWRVVKWSKTYSTYVSH